MFISSQYSNTEWNLQVHYLIHKSISLELALTFEVLTALVMNVAICWDVALCRPCENRRFEGTYRLHLQDRTLAEQESMQREVEYGNTFLRNISSRRYIPEDGNIYPDLPHRKESFLRI
jgi:hypothetical protein